jgi:sugar/nucleoside kinase (ribokinase family)
MIVTSSRHFDIPALPGRPIDPTGGGDTFMAGFLVNYLDSRDPWEAGLFGAATALLVIEGTGGVVAERMPKMSDVKERLKRSREILNV